MIAYSFFETSNYIEAGLWGLIAVIFGLCAVRRVKGARSRCLWAALIFALFSISDAIEAKTGAWWRPWWLLVWKGACVAALLGLLGDHYWRQRAKPPRE